MRVYYDTEFVERGPDHPLVLVSIGMVAEDGRELYAVSSEFDQDLVRSHPWLSEHVWPQLPLRGGPEGAVLDTGHPHVRTRGEIARMVHEFLRDTPEPQLWAWYGSYDHVLLCQLWGTPREMPREVPFLTHDLKQEAVRLGDPRLPPQRSGLHHALADARHLMRRARWLREHF
ncbi:hypothetical protein [Nocardiopsis sp. M1B1]|uniref:hypothetical protein n=1 Tax=Nocardiopsis sp. M1B1 TaxID=3450454 RepID=UPI0040391643